MKNYLKYSLGLIVFVMIALIAMHWLPAITIDGHTMRRVDLLSDVRPSKSDMEELDTDSLPPVPAVKPIFVDTCRTGMTCIEDYSDSTLRGMTPFYRALDEVSSKGRLVRIAVFGDSYCGFAGDVAKAFWRLWSRFCYYYFHDQWVSSYRAAYL